MTSRSKNSSKTSIAVKTSLASMRPPHEGWEWESVRQYTLQMGGYNEVSIKIGRDGVDVPETQKAA
jgi:hypothetical protein